MCDHTYQVGGSLPENAPSYIVRSADLELANALQQGEFCYVLNSRQMGKSSLLVRTFYKLQAQGNVCVGIDLTYLGSEFVTPLQWYKGLVAQLWTELDLTKTINLKEWWQEQELSHVQKLGEFIKLLLNFFPNQKLFIFIDEIDRIQSLNFSVDDFFALIRYCYNQRAINSNYKRIAFALFGVAAPFNLILNKELTPFNIGRAIALDGFKLGEVQPLIAGLSSKFVNAHRIMQEILAWTEGQPFLTQKLCKLSVSKVREQPLKAEDFINNIVREYIIKNWQFQDEPEHLKTIRDRLLYNPKNAGRLLGIYQQIWQFRSVARDNSKEQTELLLSGLVVVAQNHLKIKNRIYREVFNLRWVEQQLASLRLYGVNFDAWLKDENEAHLLRGLELKEALAWAENKQLSDLDYRFLAASQKLTQQETELDLARAEIEKEKAQFALYAVREANRLLTVARRNASQKIKQQRLSKSWIGIVAIALTVSVIALRFTGILQGLELTAFDLYTQQRLIIDAPSRVTIITIDESDIQNIGQFPLSDRLVARSLNNLIRHQPRVIGLDLYRDLPIPPGNEKLQKLFAATSNLIGIEKVVGVKISPPPSLDKLNQIGFADLIFDRDGAIRRALLSVRSDNGVDYSFALRLALEYLQVEDITPKPLANNSSQIKLGKTILIPLQPNDGGYVRADAGGYQTLINYRGTLDRFTHYSLSDLLANNVPAKIIRDRVVLIGSTAATISDLSPTPYSRFLSGSNHQMAWVTIHANIVAQLLDAAIDGETMLYTISETKEWLYIFIGAVAGAYIGWWVRRFWLRAIVAIFSVTITVVSTYIAFLQGWWLPVVPIAIALILATVAIAVITPRLLARMRLIETVKQLSLICARQPTVKKIALEYLKQGESQKNKVLIGRIVSRY
ncbi:CHASE2 domain-containing protein [Pleurocapsa sp. PCC 7319]|uniref:CHASE2 domain-containing protein n=1 Tax=Pleurocapsa sp. PCC 7319 TaxID=118161 RepID=UPI000349AE6E|nr:CHASE2 domain-containing protein [Pleurocapsa sp. PCC 7319]